MKTSTQNASEKNILSIGALLLTHGIVGALDYFCTFSVFSVLSTD
jgi:hypothetical protein